jgi:transposase
MLCKGMPSRSGAVHVATTTRKYKGRIYQSHLLRRTFRVGNQVRHETLGNISHLPASLIDIIRRALAGEAFLPAAETFQVLRSLPHGHVEAVLGTVRRLELASLLSSKPCRERDLVLALLVERLLNPASKLATTRLWHNSTLAEELSVEDADEDELYQALDWLLARQAQIEKKLAERHLREGSEVLYDISSSYYEGRCCSLVRYGHNRDGKRDRPIIVYGVLTDTEGHPLSVEVYPGNTGDATTVPGQVKKLRQRFGLSQVVLVGDRGMLTEKQIAQLKQHPELGWISALKTRAIRQLVEAGALQLSLFDQQNLVEIHTALYPDERLVACFNPLLAEERKRKREELLRATEQELQAIQQQVARRKKKILRKEEIALKVGRVVNRFKMAKHFALTIEDGKFHAQRRAEEIREEGLLDGVYVLRTSESKEKLSSPDVVRHYKNLANVERAFRCWKGMDIRVRPIYLRTEEHVRAHIFLCLLAYYVEWHMRAALAPLLFEEEDLAQYRQQRDPVTSAKSSAVVQTKKQRKQTEEGFPVQSFPTLLQALATRCRNTCQVQASKEAPAFEQVTQATPLQAKAFELLGL